FGQTDTDTGIWIPKSYGGSYGTNGFYLKFANSASLGTDSSGNGNNFTVNNLTSVDQTTDTPSNNFCTLNPLDNGNSNIITSNGNVSVSSSTTWDRGIKATFGVSSGKWYWEYKHGTVNTGTNPAGDLGITKYSSLINSGSNGGATSTDSYFIGGADGSKYNGSYTPTAYGSAFTTGDIAIIALDMDNGKFYMGKNGTWFNSGNPVTSTNPAYTSLSGTFLPVWYWGISAGTSGVLISDFNFGNPPYSANGYTDGAGRGNFSYAVPSGYFALCTANLSLYG
ncbi:hypothetical protein EBU71_16170, partial [bacterium]|nr:hypothetical protein [Candidatus Elulimicrobium humile]